MFPLRRNIIYLYGLKVLGVLLALVVLGGSSHALALNEIKSERVTVIYKDANLLDYALEVLEKSEASLDVITELFDFTPRHISIIINENTDGFNGSAIHFPHLKSNIFTTFPSEQILSYRSDDLLYGLMIHELTHTLQLSYAETEPSDEHVTASERAIFTIGDNSKWAPYWLIEGLATWIESEYALGGRLFDAQTQGIIHSLVLQGNVPELSDFGKATFFSEWPGGRARYLLGASFIDYLVDEYGFEAIQKALQQHNVPIGLDILSLINFQSAWKRANGTDLEDEWQKWQESILSIGQERSFTPTQALSDFGLLLNNPEISPDGTMLAWLDVNEKRSGLKIAKIANSNNSGPELTEQYLALEKTPTSFSWYSNHELLYSRISPNNDTFFADIFLFNIVTKTEKQLTFGSRLQEATYNPSNNCLLTYQDFKPQTVRLVKACFEQDALSIERVWKLEDGIHILDIAISNNGDIALSVWKEGKADIALFNPETSSIELLINDAAQDLAPSWTNEGTLLFHSDRHLNYDADESTLSASEIGVFELYELDIANLELTRLTKSLGGAFQAAAYNNTIIYSSIDAGGFRLAQINRDDSYTIKELSSSDTQYLLQDLNLKATKNDGSYSLTNPVEFNTKVTSPDLEISAYQPLDSMSPYAWAPVLNFSTSTTENTGEEDFEYTLGLAVAGQDITAKHSYTAEAAYGNMLEGHLDGSFANATYTYREGFTNYGVKAGVWPHFGAGANSIAETAFGVETSISNTIYTDNFNIRSNLRIGLIHLQSHHDAVLFQGGANVAIGDLRSDFWGYHQKGFEVEASANLTPYSNDGINAKSSSVSLTTRYAQSLEDLTGLDLGGFAEVSGNIAYRPLTASSSDEDTDDTELSIGGYLGYHQSFDTKWGLGSSTIFVERISFDSKLRSWYDTDLHIGADVGVYADMVLSYLPIFSIGIETGYADGPFYGIAFRSPFAF